jgi:hypothetical protein
MVSDTIIDCRSGTQKVSSKKMKKGKVVPC